ncbi:hypothetical protein ACROYT_G001520 [Oculina patagonica]
MTTERNTSCDFDSGLCDGWRQSYSDIFDWTRHTGSTPTSNTGPDGDHTTGLGYFMYIETSSPRVPGDNAKLELSVSGNGKLSCLEFYYHMYGDTVGTLRVFSGNVTVFNETGNHGKYWKKAKLTIYLDNTVSLEVTFEGIVGSSWSGDLAIDDVSIKNGSCQIHTAPPTDPSSSSGPSTSNPSTDKPSLSSDPSTSNPTTNEPSLSSTGASTLNTPSDNPSTSQITPKTPSTKEIQVSVILEVGDLDIRKWNERKERGFKRKVARAATDYCAVGENQCQVTPTRYKNN